MLLHIFSLALLPFAICKNINVVQSNDDGWAEINIRAVYYSLERAGFSSIISAPADNKSGTGSFDAPPLTVGSDGCEFMSCPPASPPIGKNNSMPRFNYVNSFPVTSIRFGIQNLSSQYFNGPPDIAVSGFNVGANLGAVALGSGTVGAATEAVKEGIPGIAFSGSTGSQTAWNATAQGYVNLYANLSTLVTQTLTKSGKPYLPSNVWLNVNFPDYNETTCSSVSQVKFVLSRIFTAIPIITPEDVVTCNNGGRLPSETSVVSTVGCYASISVGHADSKLDATSVDQAFVLRKLGGFLSCLPTSHHDALV